ncbi:MAG: hypothetical protein ACRD0N_06775 [Acidimicrobiales bacterium]
MSALEWGLFGFGYPTSVVVISRFVPVVRERRWRWLAVHHLGVAAIVGGWVSRGATAGAAVNGAWLVLSSAWYAAGGRRAVSARPARP